MRTMILLAALVSPLALAQHEGHDMATMNQLPVGNGGGETAVWGAWLVPSVDGIYTLPQTSVVHGKVVPVLTVQPKLGQQMILKANRAYRLWPWDGPLVWTTPDGKTLPVPAQNLLPVDQRTVAPDAPRRGPVIPRAPLR